MHGFAFLFLLRPRPELGQKVDLLPELQGKPIISLATDTKLLRSCRRRVRTPDRDPRLHRSAEKSCLRSERANIKLLLFFIFVFFPRGCKYKF
jgi:hypothetical protein